MAIDFPGTSDYEVDLGNPSSLQITGACTIMCWICLHIKQNTDIISKQTAADRGYSLQTDDDGVDNWGNFVIAVDSSTTKSTGWPTVKLAFDQWFHLAGQFIPSTAIEIWQDGVMENDNTTGIPATMHNPVNDVSIGGRPDPNGNVNGLIADVRFYDRNLSANEMQTIFAACGRDKIYDGLISRYLLNEGAPGVTVSGANSVKDLGINANHGSPLGSPTYASSELAI